MFTVHPYLISSSLRDLVVCSAARSASVVSAPGVLCLGLQGTRLTPCVGSQIVQNIVPRVD